jgi:hypothetical protein
VPSILSYANLARQLKRLPPSCGPTRLVAVDGPAGSGKTTFAARLASAAEAQVIHSDDFPVPWDGPPDAWFGPMEDAVLTPLAKGVAGRYRRYDWQREEYFGWVEVPPAPLLLLEGVGAGRRASAHLLTYLIWVEAPRPDRLLRGLDRDGVAHREDWDVWMRGEDSWFANDDTPARATLRIDGAPSLPHTPQTEFVTP